MIERLRQNGLVKSYQILILPNFSHRAVFDDLRIGLAAAFEHAEHWHFARHFAGGTALGAHSVRVFN